MTVQERIDCGWVLARYKDGTWREGTVEELEADYPFMKGEISKINWYGLNKRVAIFKKKDEKVYHLYMYSEKYEYTVHITPTYMGGFGDCRVHEPLEDWTRGNDFPDGKCDIKTFRRILYAILSYELIPYDDGSKPPQNHNEQHGERPVVDDVRNNVEFTC